MAQVTRMPNVGNFQFFVSWTYSFGHWEINYVDFVDIDSKRNVVAVVDGVYYIEADDEINLTIC